MEEDGVCWEIVRENYVASRISGIIHSMAKRISQDIKNKKSRSKKTKKRLLIKAAMLASRKKRK